MKPSNPLKTRIKEPHCLIAYSGKDSLDFLNRMSSLPVLKMKPGEFKPGYFLFPKGTIRFSFYCFKQAQDRYLFLLQTGKTQTFDSFQKYFEDMSFGESHTLNLLQSFPHLEVSLEEKPFSKDLGIFKSDPFSFSIPIDTLSFLTIELPGSIVFDDFSFENWRILKGIPKVGYEITDLINPLELGDYSSFQEQKGCYPGQEVIEVLLTRGKPSQQLVFLKTKASFSLGPYPKENPKGFITSISGSFALSFLKRSFLSSLSLPDSDSLLGIRRVGTCQR